MKKTNNHKPKANNHKPSSSPVDRMVRNALLTRAALLSSLLDTGIRDIDRECHYPDSITIDQYKKMWLREGIARRVVRCLPEESWSIDPLIYETEDTDETEFEQVWAELLSKFNLVSHLFRVDVLSGIGQYGVLLLGLDDEQDMRQPVEGVSEDGNENDGADHKLLYVRSFDESCASIVSRETNTNSPRYGQPVLYNISFQDVDATGDLSGATVGEMVTRQVHWSRTIHVADDRDTSEVYGTPRMKPVYNRLLDIRKVLSGSAEMFWKGAFPGFSFEVNPELNDPNLTIDQEGLKEQMEAYSEGLQRFIALVGLQTRSLSPQVVDPRGHVQSHLEAIAIALSIPFRILFGSEQAQLASGQDARNWNKRIARRQAQYLTPMLVRPFVQRLIAVGCLPEPKELLVDWPDLGAPTDADKASVAVQRTQAMATYVGGGVDQLVPPPAYLTQIMGMDQNEVDAILEESQTAAGGENVEGEEGAVMPNFGGQPGAPGEQPVSPMSAFNGAQVTAATQIVKDVSAGLLPRESGIGQLKVFFGLTEEQATEVMGAAGTGAKVVANPGVPESRGKPPAVPIGKAGPKPPFPVVHAGELGVQHSHSSVQADIPEPLATKLINWAEEHIPDEDLASPENDATFDADMGRERLPHVTVRYGFTTDDVAEVRKALEGVEPFVMRLGQVSRFNSNPEYSVLKVDVASPELETIHKRLGGIANETDFIEYQPHLTLAYVQKGRLGDMVGAEDFAGETVKVDRLIFCTRDGQRHVIPLWWDRSTVTENYDPDQPRDETGKWTDGSGGAPASGTSFSRNEWEKKDIGQRRDDWAAKSEAERDKEVNAKQSVSVEVHSRTAFAGERPATGEPFVAAKQRLGQLAEMIPGDASARIQDHAHRIASALKEVGADPDVSRKITLDAVDALAAQESESLGRTLGDHGVRHVLGNAEYTEQILSAIHGRPLTPQEKLEVELTAVYHDTGYLTKPSQVFLDEGHKRWSAQHYEANVKSDVEGVLGKDVADRIQHSILTHDDTTMDWNTDAPASAFRVADNIALFHAEKLPGLFKYVPENVDVLERLGKKEITLDQAKAEVLENIKTTTHLKPMMVEQLVRSAKEMNTTTPKFTLGMMGGKIASIGYEKEAVHVTVERNAEAARLHKVLDLGQAQFAKFAKTYNVDPKEFNKRDAFDFGGPPPQMHVSVTGLKLNWVVDNFDPDQPREPAGTSEGGQFASEGGGKIVFDEKSPHQTHVKYCTGRIESLEVAAIDHFTASSHCAGPWLRLAGKEYGQDPVDRLLKLVSQDRIHRTMGTVAKGKYAWKDIETWPKEMRQRIEKKVTEDLRKEFARRLSRDNVIGTTNPDAFDATVFRLRDEARQTVSKPETVYRGILLHEDQADKIQKSLDTKGYFDLQVMPVSSYTSSKTLAERFAWGGQGGSKVRPEGRMSLVYSTEVNKENVWMHWKSPSWKAFTQRQKERGGSFYIGGTSQKEVVVGHPKGVIRLTKDNSKVY